MDFHRCLASSNFDRYVFIEPTPDQRQDLSVRQVSGIQNVPAEGNFCLARPPGHVPFQRELNGIQQILITQWLGEEFNGARLLGPHRHRGP